MDAINSSVVTLRGALRAVTYVDLNAMELISIIHIFGQGEIDRITTPIPNSKINFDELYSSHRLDLFLALGEGGAYEEEEYDDCN